MYVEITVSKTKIPDNQMIDAVKELADKVGAKFIADNEYTSAIVGNEFVATAKLYYYQKGTIDRVLAILNNVKSSNPYDAEKLQEAIKELTKL